MSDYLLVQGSEFNPVLCLSDAIMKRNAKKPCSV